MTVDALPAPARLAELDVRAGEVALWWLGQSSFLLRFDRATVLVDPFLTPHRDRLVPPPFAADDAVGIDVVAVTHDHFDHLDAESLPVVAAASPGARFVAPRPLVDRLGVDAGRVTGLQPGDAADLGAVRIHAVAAAHGDLPADAYGFSGAAGDGLCRFLGYVFEAGGVRVYHAGDTIPYDGLADTVRELRPDVALLPVNGRDEEREALGIVGNLDEREAVELAAAVGAELLVPMHYDMFAANPGSPGTAVELARDHPQLAVLVASRERPFLYRSTR